MLSSIIFLLAAAICQVNCQWNMFGWNKPQQHHQHHGSNNNPYDKTFGSEVQFGNENDDAAAAYAGWYSNFNKDQGGVDMDADTVIDLLGHGQHQQQHQSCNRVPQYHGQPAHYSHHLRAWCYPSTDAPAAATTPSAPASKRDLCGTLSVFKGALQANSMHQCQAFPNYDGANQGK